MAQLNSDGVGSALVLQDGTVLVYGSLEKLGGVNIQLSQRPMPLEEWFDPGRKIVVSRKALSAEIGCYRATIVSQEGELFTWGSARAAGGGGNHAHPSAGARWIGGGVRRAMSRREFSHRCFDRDRQSLCLWI